MRGPGQGEEDKDVVVVEHIEESSRSSQTDDPDGALLAPSRRAHAERNLVRTLDMRLLPTIILIFIMNYIDVSRCFLCVLPFTEIVSSGRP